MPAIDVVPGVAVPGLLIAVDLLGDVVTIDQQVGIRSLLYLALAVGIRTLQHIRILGIGVALGGDELLVPNAMEVGVAAEPLHLNGIAALIVHMGHMHRTIAVAGEMDEEAQGMGIGFRFMIYDFRFYTIQRAIEVAALSGIMHKSIGYLSVGESRREILVVPSVADGLGVDGVGLDLVRPVGPVDDTMIAQGLVDGTAGTAGEVVVRNLSDNTMALLSPREDG